MEQSLTGPGPAGGVVGQYQRQGPLALGVRHLVVPVRMAEPTVAVGVDLCQPLHAVLPKVRPGLPHLVSGYGVIARLAGGVGHHDRGNHADLVAAVAVEEGDPLDAWALTGELVEEVLPGRLRQDEVHLGLRSGVARGSRRDG